MTVWLVDENTKLKSDIEFLKSDIEALKSDLDQAHYEYKELEDKYNLASKQYDSLLKQYNEVLKLAKDNADANEYVIQELEQENERLKQVLEENGIFEV